MKSFKNKMNKKRSVIGNKIINSDEAMGVVFKDSDKKISEVKVTALQKNPYQPRKKMDELELKGLAISIKENGLLQPIVISPIKNSSKDFYIVAGHRRVEAYKLLDIKNIDAIIIQCDENDLKIYSILENLQRENLTAYEEAISIRNLVDTGIKQTELVDKLGKSKSYISQMIKISSINKDVITYINSKDNLKIGISILFELSNVEFEKQLEVYKYIEKNSLNREQIRKYVKKLYTSIPDIKVSPAKLSSFSFSSKGSAVTIKLDFDKIQEEEKTVLLSKLTDIIERLKV